MKTRQEVQATLDIMSVNEKAKCLNLMRLVRYTGTPLVGCDISDCFEGYNKTNNIIIDSFLWKAYGLHYKDYVASDMGPFLIVDPVKLEAALDKSIMYWLEELGQVEPQPVTEN